MHFLPPPYWLQCAGRLGRQGLIWARGSGWRLDTNGEPRLKKELHQFEMVVNASGHWRSGIETEKDELTCRYPVKSKMMNLVTATSDADSDSMSGETPVLGACLAGGGSTGFSSAISSASAVRNMKNSRASIVPPPLRSMAWTRKGRQRGPRGRHENPDIVARLPNLCPVGTMCATRADGVKVRVDFGTRGRRVDVEQRNGRTEFSAVD